MNKLKSSFSSTIIKYDFSTEAWDNYEKLIIKLAKTFPSAELCDVGGGG